ncbi:MAG TPA: site-specific integrase [Mucilaginibacter sp.]|jgi:hypothetical protein
MATVNAVVYEHHKRADGTYNVKIKIFHQKKRAHIETAHYVSAKQLNCDLQIKDKFILKILEITLEDYRRSISEFGERLEFFTAEQLRDYLQDKDKPIDFIEFCSKHIEFLRQSNRNGTANNHRVVRNSLVDYFKKEQVLITEVNAGMLKHYEKWLRCTRIMTRINQLGKEVNTTEAGMQNGGVYSHMRDLRTLFNEARRQFNNEDLGIIRIKHYPFKAYKIGAPPKTKKRNISAEDILKIRDCHIEPGGRAELARDLFMLSFYLCGINAVDLYNFEAYSLKDKRLEYNRSKTSGKRTDEAFISIKIVREARPLLAKYVGKLHDQYSTYTGLDTALSKGMRQLRTILEISVPITFYWARHSFATIARNKCGISKDDIAEALNHVDREHRTTDIYIEKSWETIDNVQEAVLNYLGTIGKNDPKGNDITPSEKHRQFMRVVS